MRRALLAGAALTVALGAQSAWADVDVVARITKDKDITVFEDLFKLKTVDVTVTVIVLPDKSAESLALVNQDNNGNEGCTNCAERSDEIIGSIGADTAGGNSGVVTVNQAAGNMNNQGNNLAVAVDVPRGFPGGPDGGGGPTPEQVGDGFAEAQASTDQANGVILDRTLTPVGVTQASNVVDAINLLFRDALIENSINDNAGVVLVNQAPGNMNNQANNVSVAVSYADVAGVALAEADLGQITSYNIVRESQDGLLPSIGINKSANVTGSMSGNTGIIAANQGAGNMSNQSNTMAMAVVILPPGI